MEPVTGLLMENRESTPECSLTSLLFIALVWGSETAHKVGGGQQLATRQLCSSVTESVSAFICSSQF